MVWRVCKHVQRINVNTMLIRWREICFKCLICHFMIVYFTATFSFPPRNVTFFNSMTPLHSRLSLKLLLLSAAGSSSALMCPVTESRSRSGLTEVLVCTIWTSTSGDGVKKPPMSAQMGKWAHELISWSSVGLTQTSEAAADKRSTDLHPK